MSHLNAVEVLTQEITLVLSAVVLVFWIAYSLMLYNQHKHGTVRSDWWISMVFYAGIALLVLGNLLLSASQLYHSSEGENVSLYINIISMAIFVYAFNLRMRHALAPESVEKPDWFAGEGKAGRKKRR